MWAVTALLVAALAQQPPAPGPFPRPAQPAQPVRPGEPPRVEPAPPPDVQPPDRAPGNEQAPAESLLGVPVYPGSQFLSSYDAGRGQRFYMYGTTAPFLDVVTFYRTVLKQRGTLIFDAPATHQFEVGDFREATMAFPPGVTVKEFQSQVSQGYPNPRLAAQPARFPTVIQIVPVVGR